MNNELIGGVLVGIGLIFVFYAFYCFFVTLSTISKTLTDLVASIKNINRLSIHLLRNKEKVGTFVNDIEEILLGANKINQDAVTANAVLANEVMRFRDSAEKLHSVMFPAYEQEAERTPQRIKANYDMNYADLIEQGLDPEEAKWKAAALELEEIEKQGVTSNSGFTL